MSWPRSLAGQAAQSGGKDEKKYNRLGGVF